MFFADREAVMDWMDANQLGRRNLTPDAFRLALGRRYNCLKKAQGGDRKSKDQIEPISTAAKLAAEEIGADVGVTRQAVEKESPPHIGG
jgi:hypothetical protein